MKFHNFMIAILLFSTVVVVGLASVVNVTENYAKMGIFIDIDETQSATFDKASDINSKADAIRGGIEGTDAGDEDSDTTFLGGAWAGVQLTVNSLSISGTLIQDVLSTFYVPQAIITFIVTSVILTVIFTAIYMMFKYTGE